MVKSIDGIKFLSPNSWNYYCKILHLSSLTGFWIDLCKGCTKIWFLDARFKSVFRNLSNTENFAKIVDDEKPLTVLAKWSLLDVWRTSEYAYKIRRPSMSGSVFLDFFSFLWFILPFKYDITKWSIILWGYWLFCRIKDWRKICRKDL